MKIVFVKKTVSTAPKTRTEILREANVARSKRAYERGYAVASARDKASFDAAVSETQKLANERESVARQRADAEKEYIRASKAYLRDKQMYRDDYQRQLSQMGKNWSDRERNEYRAALEREYNQRISSSKTAYDNAVAKRNELNSRQTQIDTSIKRNLSIIKSGEYAAQVAQYQSEQDAYVSSARSYQEQAEDIREYNRETKTIAKEKEAVKMRLENARIYQENGKTVYYISGEDGTRVPVSKAVYDKVVADKRKVVIENLNRGTVYGSEYPPGSTEAVGGVYIPKIGVVQIPLALKDVKSDWSKIKGGSGKYGAPKNLEEFFTLSESIPTAIFGEKFFDHAPAMVHIRKSDGLTISQGNTGFLNVPKGTLQAELPEYSESPLELFPAIAAGVAGGFFGMPRFAYKAVKAGGGAVVGTGAMLIGKDSSKYFAPGKEFFSETYTGIKDIGKMTTTRPYTATGQVLGVYAGADIFGKATGKVLTKSYDTVVGAGRKKIIPATIKEKPFFDKWGNVVYMQRYTGIRNLKTLKVAAKKIVSEGKLPTKGSFIKGTKMLWEPEVYGGALGLKTVPKWVFDKGKWTIKEVKTTSFPEAPTVMHATWFRKLGKQYYGLPENWKLPKGAKNAKVFGVHVTPAGDIGNVINPSGIFVSGKGASIYFSRLLGKNAYKESFIFKPGSFVKPRFKYIYSEGIAVSKGAFEKIIYKNRLGGLLGKTKLKEYVFPDLDITKPGITNLPLKKLEVEGINFGNVIPVRSKFKIKLFGRQVLIDEGMLTNLEVGTKIKVSGIKSKVIRPGTSSVIPSPGTSYTTIPRSFRYGYSIGSYKKLPYSFTTSYNRSSKSYKLSSVTSSTKSSKGSSAKKSSSSLSSSMRYPKMSISKMSYTPSYKKSSYKKSYKYKPPYYPSYKSTSIPKKRLFNVNKKTKKLKKQLNIKLLYKDTTKYKPSLVGVLTQRKIKVAPKKTTGFDVRGFVNKPKKNIREVLK